MQKLIDFVDNDGYIIAAHRGASGSAPENTASAFRLALEQGAVMIEIDIQNTKDGAIVVFHDDVLGRTTNGSGRVKNFTLEELRKLDAGSWFSETFKGEKIISLAETLEIIKDKAYLSIEIKPSSCLERQEDAVRSIVNIINENSAADYVLLASFDYNALDLVKRYDNNLHTAAIKIPQDKRCPSEIKRLINCDAFVCSIKELSKKLCAAAIDSGLFVGVYNVNTVDELEKVLKYNVKALGTNNPKDIISAIKMKEHDSLLYAKK